MEGLAGAGLLHAGDEVDLVRRVQHMPQLRGRTEDRMGQESRIDNGLMTVGEVHAVPCAGRDGIVHAAAHEGAVFLLQRGLFARQTLQLQPGGHTHQRPPEGLQVGILRPVLPGRFALDGHGFREAVLRQGMQDRAGDSQHRLEPVTAGIHVYAPPCYLHCIRRAGRKSLHHLTLRFSIHCIFHRNVLCYRQLRIGSETMQKG